MLSTSQNFSFKSPFQFWEILHFELYFNFSLTNTTNEKRKHFRTNTKKEQKNNDRLSPFQWFQQKIRLQNHPFLTRSELRMLENSVEKRHFPSLVIFSLFFMTNQMRSRKQQNNFPFTTTE